MDELSKSIQNLSEGDVTQIIRSAGIVGAGGAGFPTYKKWSNLEDVDNLLINLQESEPIFYSDKNLVSSNPESFQKFFQWVLDNFFESVVIGSKEKYRDEWIKKLEQLTDGSIYLHDDLPIDLEEDSGVIFGYTHDVYDFSRDFSLLRVLTGVDVYPNLPTEHGWITQNTETVYNIYKAIFEGKPVTEKFVHINGNTPMHRCLKAPIGTPTKDLLKEAGVETEALKQDQILLEGGPGWCSALENKLAEYGLSKRTNGLLVMDRKIVEEGRAKNEENRINILDKYEWSKKNHEKQPENIQPDIVRIPLLSNPHYRGKVQSSQPIVDSGDRVEKEQVIAIPNSNGISIPQHASIDGVVEEVTSSHITIEK